MKIYFDGSCGPKNPGDYACYAFVILEGEEEVFRQNGIECQGKYATNNVAEYAGLKHALKFLTENSDVREIEIYGDSQLVINQVNGDWKCKMAHLQNYLCEIQELLEKFDSWTATWVPRKQNSLADELSKWQSVVKENS